MSGLGCTRGISGPMKMPQKVDHERSYSQPKKAEEWYSATPNLGGGVSRILNWLRRQPILAAAAKCHRCPCWSISRFRGQFEEGSPIADGMIAFPPSAERLHWTTTLVPRSHEGLHLWRPLLTALCMPLKPQPSDTRV
eukprot:6156726-Amphidinium_carterae.2